jgi:hypothetical protein
MVAVTTKGESSLRNVLRAQFMANGVQTPSYGSRKVEELMLKNGSLFRKGRPERLTAMLVKALSDGALEFDVCFRAQTLFITLSPIELFAQKFLDTLDRMDPKGFCNITNSRFLLNFRRSSLYREMREFMENPGCGPISEYCKSGLDEALVKQLKFIAKMGFTDTTIFHELRH